MQISVVYAGELAQAWINLAVEENCTVGEAIHKSGVLVQFPEIDIDAAKVGIYGKFSSLEAELSDGDRVEIYRPITRVLDEDDDDDEDDD